MHPARIALLLVLCVSISTAVKLGGSWAKFGADGRNTGLGAGQGPSAKTGSCQWTYVGKTNDVREDSMCSPVLWEDGSRSTVYVAFPGELHAVNATSQEQRWRISTEDIGGNLVVPSQLLVTSSGSVWCGGAGGVLRVIDDGLADEPQVAHYFPNTTDEVFRWGPALSSDGRLVFFGSDSGAVVAFSERETPLRIVWRNRNPCQVLAPLTNTPALSANPVVYDQEWLYIGARDHVCALRQSNGSSVWAENPPTGADVTGLSLSLSAVGTPVIIAAHSNGFLTAFRALSTGDHVLWQAEIDRGTSLGQPSISPGGEYVYVGTGESELFQVSMADQSKKMLLRSSGAFYGAPAVDSTGVVYGISSDGKLYGVDSGTLVVTLVAPNPGLHVSPAIGEDGSVYVVGYESMFVFVPEPCEVFQSHSGKRQWYYYFTIILLPIIGGVIVLFSIVALIVWIRRRKMQRAMESDLLINSEDAAAWTNAKESSNYQSL